MHPAAGRNTPAGSPMRRKYLAFDIETAQQWPDGCDWRRYRPLGISCAATLPGGTATPTLWHGLTGDRQPADRMSRQDAARLVGHLASMVRQGYTILTWNGLAFDFDILAEESGMPGECKTLARDHVDMMFYVFCELGYPVGLDAAARAMNLPGKPEGMTGLLAPRMWAEGKRQEVLDYVTRDVQTTLDLATLCERRGCLRWVTRQGASRRMPLPRGWLEVRSAAELPEPDTSWMSRPLSRRNFTAWLQA
jgi:hypothetical protein